MQGWQVVTADDDKLGRVVAELDDYVIVEHGHLLKSRHPIPKTYVHVREQEKELCVSLPKDMITDSPKVAGEQEFDREEAARHYGLAEGTPDPPTEGYGEIEPGDPAYGADRDGEAAGVVPTERLRAEIQTHKRDDTSPSSPALLGDRKQNNARET